MKAQLRRISERVLLGALLLAFISPLPLTAVVQRSPNHFAWARWMRHPWFLNSTLGGVTIPAPPSVPFSRRALATGEFQKSKAGRFNVGFAGREAFIRWTGEIWFRLFHETATLNSTVAVGYGDALLEKVYLDEYFIQRIDQHPSTPWVDDLRRLQDFCRQIGMGFVVVITPSKASIQPEDTPLAWRRRYDPRPRNVVHLIELFQERGIVFVNGPALLAAEKLAHKPAVPFFPKGGTHWNSHGAFLAANAIQARFREQGKSLAPLEIMGSTFSDEPRGTDGDLVRVMNLARPWKYPCERISIKPGEKPVSEQLTMEVVGGSFSEELVRQLSASREFSEIGFHYYYKLKKMRAGEGLVSNVRAPGTPNDFASEIFAADCLLLEINEASAAFSSQYLSAFLTDALAHLPDPAAARPPFRSDR